MALYIKRDKNESVREERPIIYCFSFGDQSKFIKKGEYSEDDIVETRIFFQGGDLDSGKVVEGLDNSLTVNRQDGFILQDFLKRNIVLIADPNMDLADKPTFEEVKDFYTNISNYLILHYVGCDENEPYPTHEYIATYLIEKFKIKPFELPENPTKEGHGAKTKA